jgi:hypothetical protein
VKYLDFSSLLDGEPLKIACLSTFQFDPDYFERRLLRSPALSKARRIMVFLDARQWFQRLRQDIPARWINRRYLVVPVLRSHGVFHPKLSLLLSESGGQVLCGSNNLTRAGCSSNLELLNAVPFVFDTDNPDALDLARESFRFFERAATETDTEISRVAKEWLAEAGVFYPWLKAPLKSTAKERKVRLLHTYDGSMWERLVKHLSHVKPRNILVISPFHDSDGDACRRLVRQWPQARIELVVQQGYTNLAVKPLRKMSTVRLSELRGVSRRLHAKMVAWQSTKGGGCLVGSANFTSAALDGRNIETSLLLSEADELVHDLFDGKLSRRPIAMDEFERGDADEPSAEEALPPLRIDSVLLAADNELRVRYSHSFTSTPRALRLNLRTPGESRPRISISLSSKERPSHSVALPDGAFANTSETLLATLAGEFEGSKIESPAAWVIQESQLTFEPGEGSSSPKGRIEESGDGLPEYLDGLGNQEGASAVIEYLSHLTIRFDDGGTGRLVPPKFRLKIRDPFRTDEAPPWLIKTKEESDDLEEAIYEFVERHEKQRLRRHVARGNINGMENFLDIFQTLIRLLYIYFRRGIVRKGQLIHRVCQLIEIAMIGCKREDEDPLDGYLTVVYNRLSGDRPLFQDICRETNYVAEVRAVLVIIQSIRFNRYEKPKYGPKAARPREVLPKWAKAVKSAITGCKLVEPPASKVRIALENFNMLSEKEIKGMLAEMP